MINDRPHKRLTLWIKSLEMVKAVYDVTKNFPRDEEFGLKAQLRRAAVSVPSNIAEGLTRRSKNDKLRFLNMADSSLSEIDTQLEISHMLGVMEKTSFERVEFLLVAVEQLLGGLRRKISK